MRRPQSSAFEKPSRSVATWWRDSDGDVADGLVDALTDLSPTGYIWLLTPKVGRPGTVGASEISEAAQVAEQISAISFFRGYSLGFSYDLRNSNDNNN